MRISVPREIKPEEARVGLTPTMVTALTAQGHEVFVEEGAGLGAGFSDDDYREAGAQLTSQEEAWAQAELLVKVKEPIPAEYGFLRSDLTVFTYLHLAASRELTEAMLDSGVTGIAYETVDITQDADARDRVMSLGYLQAPVVMVDDDEHWSGFRLDRIKALSRRSTGITA